LEQKFSGWERQQHEIGLKWGRKRWFDTFLPHVGYT